MFQLFGHKNKPKQQLDPNQPVLYIEHCRSRKQTLSRAMQRIDPNVKLQLQLNADGEPRSQSFEVAIAPAPTSDIMSRQILWTGLMRTCATKVPHVDDIVRPACHALKMNDRTLLSWAPKRLSGTR
ncbi:selenoprotein BthD [Scaptodrosophila lebanonensis]|uniref:Selenoprotein BthD n=1 Tax=Drosophila lebanonensis TaxID=7225 RepID=A0A6J2U4E2_DROLE|nr:selenoprotein BthD [Scaptodrosophila lebanonensis]